MKSEVSNNVRAQPESVQNELDLVHNKAEGVSEEVAILADIEAATEQYPWKGSRVRSITLLLSST